MNAAPATTAVPNWAEIPTEPHCPLCDYMLRGLTTPRCPECGYTFEWAEVLDASRRDHPYLFEHHPERNVWSYFKTVFGAMRPRRFWSHLHPAQYGSTRRLLISHFTSLAALLATVLITPAVCILIAMVIEPYFPHYQRFRFSRPPFGVRAADELLRVYSDWQTQRAFLNGVLVASAWPWTAFLALQVFQLSMRKAKVKSVHVLRCVVYALDHWVVICMWTVVVSSVFIMEVVRQFTPTFYRIPRFENLTIACMAAVVILHTDRLGVAYRRYLRFDHALPVAISAQLITLLSMLIVLVFINSL